MAVQANHLPSHSVKTFGTMKAERTVKRIIFNPTEANPGNNLYVSVRSSMKMSSLCLDLLPYSLISILEAGMRISCLKCLQALVDRFVVKYAGTTVQDTNGCDIYEIFKDLFLSTDEGEEMILEGL